MTTTTIPEFATIIVAQLGGAGIFAMAFERMLYDQGRQSVTLHVAKALRRATKAKITHVAVKLDGDLYEVTFYAVRGLDWNIVETVPAVYADSLRRLVEERTGLRTRL